MNLDYISSSSANGKDCAAGTQVKVYGTPQTDGTYKAYVLMYFTNTEPAD